MARLNREGALANAVARAFKQAGFVATDLLQGQIMLTELPWQCPPLVCTELLDSYAFEDYINYPLSISIGEMGIFWKRGMAGLFANPASVVTARGWRNLSPVLSAADGERALRFSIPEEFPQFTPLSGHIFTMELVQLLLNSAPVDSFVSDADNFYITSDAAIFGIKDGLIYQASDDWAPVNGIVDSLATNPRGQIRTTSRYDLLAKVRSLLYEYPERFEEFTGIDYALQALGMLSKDRLCSSLQDAIAGMLPDDFEARRKITIIDEAYELLSIWSSNDRIKLVSLHEMLVPDVYSETTFSTRIFDLNVDVLPAVLADKTMAKIKGNLWKDREKLFADIGPRDKPSYERPSWMEPT